MKNNKKQIWELHISKPIYNSLRFNEIHDKIQLIES